MWKDIVNKKEVTSLTQDFTTHLVGNWFLWYVKNSNNITEQENRRMTKDIQYLSSDLSVTPLLSFIIYLFT